MKNILTLILCLLTSFVFAQNLYEIDLNTIKKNKLFVKLTLKKCPEKDTVLYSFPASLPGTYATEDFGRFIHNLNAITSDGKKLKTHKINNNTFRICNAKNLKYIEYDVSEIFGKKIKENRIFSPIVTKFEKDKIFTFNNGAIFGFFNGEELNEINIKIEKPTKLYGVTSLPQIHCSSTQQLFKAATYHQLIDCPIMFSIPDTAQFEVGKTKVTISVFDVNGKPRAKHFYELLNRDMHAIDSFLPDIPVDQYSFLIFVDEKKDLGKGIVGTKNFLQILKILLGNKSFDIGALEHGNSSSFYLADFGITDSINYKDYTLDYQLTSAAIHEFMHIITPLGLHDQHIGNFNYLNPIMSKHLWLYEGVTEYFAHLIKLKAGIYSPKEYLKVMREKLIQGLDFPYSTMSFTEMSANVLNKHYKEQYPQVYQRGAILAMLLDAEIQRLTESKKNLLDVLLTLHGKYGVNKSFDESNFISEFVNEVHPDLRTFFNNYIEGKNKWKPNEQLDYIGITYLDTTLEKDMLSIFLDNDISTKSKNGIEFIVTKVGINEWAGLKLGDKINVDNYKRAFLPNNKKLKEGEIAKLKLIRDKKNVTLDIKVKYGLVKKKHILRWTSPKE